MITESVRRTGLVPAAPAQGRVDDAVSVVLCSGPGKQSRLLGRRPSEVETCFLRGWAPTLLVSHERRFA